MVWILMALMMLGDHDAVLRRIERRCTWRQQFGKRGDNRVLDFALMHSERGVSHDIFVCYGSIVCKSSCSLKFEVLTSWRTRSRVNAADKLTTVFIWTEIRYSKQCNGLHMPTYSSSVDNGQFCVSAIQEYQKSISDTRVLAEIRPLCQG